MAQSLQPFGTNPAAEEGLRMGELQRGLPHFADELAPVGPNLQDRGGYTAPNGDGQAPLRAQQALQTQSENHSTAVRGAQANALGQLRASTAAQNNAEAKANEQLVRTKAEILYANEGGAATFKMGMPEVQNMVGAHVQEQSLMARGINPQYGPTTLNRTA